MSFFKAACFSHLLLAIILLLSFLLSPAMADLVPAGSAVTGSSPGGVDVYGGSVYVACSGSNQLMKFDASTLASQGSAATGSGPADVAVYGGSVYVVCSGSNQLMKFDASTLARQGEAETGPMPNVLTVYGGSVFICGDRWLEKYDASTLELQGASEIGSTPGDIVGYAGSVYVTCRNPNSLEKYDASTLEFQNSAVPDSAPIGMAMYGGSLYVACQITSKLMKFDASTLANQGMVGTGSAPLYVAAYSGSIYVTCLGTSQLMKFDASTLARQGGVGTGISPLCVAANDGSVYVTSYGNNNQLMKFVEAYSIKGRVWGDLDSDGSKDATEQWLPGATVYIDKPDVANPHGNGMRDVGENPTTTDSTGLYTLQNLPPGTYNVRVEWFTTFPSQGYMVVTLTSSDVSGMDLGRGPSLSGIVFDDLDGDAVQDPDESGLSGRTVTLKDFSGTLLSTTSTSSTGSYYFNQDPGTYILTEDIPNDRVRTGFSITGATEVKYGSGIIFEHSTFQQGDTSAKFNIVPGTPIKASIGDSLPGFFTVTEYSSPQRSAQTFSFSSSKGAPASFSLGHNQSQSFTGVLPRTYTIKEESVPHGWGLTAISCTGTGVSAISYSSDGTNWHGARQGGDDRVRFELAPGASGNIIFNNTQTNITVMKSVSPLSGLDFTFSSVSPSGTSNFMLKGDGSGIRTFVDLDPGDYIIGEEGQPEGWALNNIQGTGTGKVQFSNYSNSWHDSYQNGDCIAKVTLAAGQTSAITFTDCQLNSIAITKSASPISDRDFTFNSPSLNGGLDFTLKGDGTSAGTRTFTDLPSGSYIIQEKSLPSGWGISNITSSGSASVVFSSDGKTWHSSYQEGDDRINVTLGTGQSSIVTFSDSQTSITMVKSAIPNSDEDFTFNSAELNSGSDFTLKGDGSGMKSFTDLAAGSYIIQEKSLPPGWIISSIKSSGSGTVQYSSDGMIWNDSYQSGDDRVNITLIAGQASTITFEDSQLNSIAIIKSASPASDQEFTFNSAELNGGSDFALKGDGTGKITFDDLPSDDYIIQETGLPSGWGISNIESSGTARANFSSDGFDWHDSYQTGDDRINVTMGLGQWSMITFNNSQTKITVVKSADPKTDEEFTFSSFTLNDGSDFTLKGDGTGTRTFVDLTSGDYIVQETNLPPGWNISNIESTGTANITFSSDDIDWHDLYRNGDDRAKATLADGQHSTITFYDAQINSSSSGLSISGRKFEDINGDGAKDEGDPLLDGWTVRLYNSTGLLAETITEDDGWYSFNNLSNGSYQVKEEARAGWVQTYPGTGSHDIDLENDFEDADFGNTPQANITLRAYLDKSVATPTDQLDLSLELSNQGEIELSKVNLTLELPKGLRFVQSSTPPDQIASSSDGSATLVWQNLLPSDEQPPAEEQYTRPLYEQSEQSTANELSDLSLNIQIMADGSRLGEIEARARAYALAINGLNASCEASASVSIQPSLLVVSKTADVSSATMGDNITYTIKVCNPTGQDLGDIAIKDVFNRDVEIISASPEFDKDGLWHINLGPGECAVMTLVVRVPKYDIRFDSGSGVSGYGYVNVHNDFKAIPGPYVLKNCVYVSGDGIGNTSACADVAVGTEDGTELSKREHGSGSYEEDEISRLRLENRSIRIRSSLSAGYSSTIFALPGDRSLSFQSLWGTDLITRNRLTGTSMRESYRYATVIEKDEYVDLDKNASTLWTDARFEGRGHLGYIDQPSVDRKVKPNLESREDYAGIFRINGSIDAYGSSVITNRSASGIGLVSNDKRIRSSQRTYEYGTGSYQSEEMIRTPESYMAKDIQADYSPINQPGLSTGIKWGEGIWSQSKGRSFLGSQISGADYIDKEATAGGLSDLKTSENFSGRGSFKAVLKQEVGGKVVDKARFEEEYSGGYSLNRKVHLTGVSVYDKPHLYIVKEGSLVNDPLKYNYTVARYVITVLNDGNTALGPVYVRDVFPAGSEYINSSVRPSQLTSGYANWTFVYLPIGQMLRIELSLLMGDDSGDLINLAYASGGYDDKWVSSGNFSALQRSWLPCCNPDVQAYKTAYIDPTSPDLIRYRISIKNRGDYGIVARVIDILPLGLKFINSSIEPEGRYNLSWVMPEIAPGKIGAIDYLVQAQSSGRYVNQAHIEAHALDGSGSSDVDVSAAVVVGEAAPAIYGPAGDASGWKPPEWGLDLSDNICGGNESCALYSSCPSCTSTGDIP